MDALECIHTRRSIRKYVEKEVSDDLIKQILDAAMTAPSAWNQQPWHFIIIKDRELLDKIPEFHEYAKMCKQANVAILVCFDVKLATIKDMVEQDCSAATMNILLAAHALGLGAVWCGVYPKTLKIDGFRKLLKIPEDITPFSLIPIGYTEVKSAKQDRYKKNRVHENIW